MEKPNLLYIEQLARGDDAIKNTLIEVIKNEFPDEKVAYYKSLKNKDFKKKANDFEHNLREHILSLEEERDFDEILTAISKYLKTI